MRRREQIESEANGYTRGCLEVLLDIRDLLVAQAERVGTCDHGNTGICMYCVIGHDLLRPRKGG